MSRRIAFLLSLTVGLTLIGGFDDSLAARRSEPARFEPDPGSSEPTLAGRTWRVQGPSWRAELQKLTDEERRAYIEHTTGVTVDPFVLSADKSGRFETFVLILENVSEGTLRFNAWNCWLTPNTNRIETPLDLARMRSAYRVLETEMPPAYERAAAALFDGESSLLAGERRSGLLIFRLDDRKAKRYTVEVPLTLTNGDEAGFKVAYRRVKPN